MKKVIIATMLASAALTGTAFANAPAMDLAAGQGQFGYSYNNLKTDISAIGDLGTLHANNFQGAYALTDKLAVTGDYLNTESQTFYSYKAGGYLRNLNINSTQLGLQYKLSHNLAVTAGNAKTELKANNNSVSTSEAFAGVAYKTALTNHVDGYASYSRSSNIEDWKTGLTYNVGSNLSVDAGYRHFETKDIGSKAEGMGFGVNYKF
ncbi:hypothetical protein SRRS_28750 [Sporomusa rhizae]|uniref:hypothetical protein n=1 Tax=Sporomusa rhizae TaxID=357999 RepID=UPI00352B242B